MPIDIGSSLRLKIAASIGDAFSPEYNAGAVFIVGDGRGSSSIHVTTRRMLARLAAMSVA